ncbi:hypothetical protein LWI29_025040 [Acer saccharum]|uniref:CCHC-type domain-containing protein n=1 Tax=Acer saccharum TaxID=4024 RepID=A0AA39VFX6_ACESA|nr:hypothetical protein LWI29_025040 [Acer saccharum]
MLMMEENECFNDFEIKLMDIVNQSHQLGDPYSYRRIKQKIMRSLPERFVSKVTILEENSTYKNMELSEVIRRLIAYEFRKGPTSTPPKKQKGIALKASNVEKEENDDSDKEMALLMRRFKKFYKSKKKGFRSKGQDLKKKTPFKKFEPRQEKTERKGVQCYECSGIGHFTLDCANHKNKKKRKVMAATWSGSDDSNEGDESSDDEELMANFIAFTSSHKSKSTNEEEEESQEENDSSDDGSSSQSTNGNVDKMDLQDYMVKFESSRLKNKREIKRLKEENLELSTHVDQLSEEVVRSMKNEDKLREELALAKRNEEGLKRELE